MGLWYIHGKAYDLRRFLAHHPGGSEQLMVGEGRDCTELFESMHWRRPVAIPSKYMVDSNDAPKSIFKWELTRKFYETVSTEWKHRETKAGKTFWMICGVLWTLQAIGLYYWWWLHHWYAAFAMGLSNAMLGYMIFHTAGHNGISNNPRVNRFWFELYANWIIGFFSPIWDLHHNYGHHCYTNIYRKDPDVNNSKSFLRKTLEQSYRKIYRYQLAMNYGLLVFFPGQWLGQLIEYVSSVEHGRIFGSPMHQRETHRYHVKKFLSIATTIIVSLLITQGILRTLLGVYLYSFGFGLLYWAAVFPNHETEKSQHSSINHVKDTDWLVHQLTHTSNFALPHWLSYLIGGMNYQIEHHIFPTVHPRFYPELSSFVRKFCVDHGIRYNCHGSWWDAFKSNYRAIKSLSID